MAVPQRYDDLARFPLFVDLPRDRRSALARPAVRIELSQGDQLFEEGSEGHEFVAVIEGRVVVRHGDVRVATLEAGDYLGEAALVDHAHRNATAEADCDETVIVCVGQDEFKALVDEFPHVAEAIRATASARAPERQDGA